ncbi:hypothetical protein R5N98_12620 [Tenacibaculum maritimum]|uniref:hypothetical protein n=1 Tax=Tenacibaculum maritimum TaxID=107401 RepID=UPI00388D8CEB
MKRSDFIKKTSAATFLLSTLPIFKLFPQSELNDNIKKHKNLADIDLIVKREFDELFVWMLENGWIESIESILGEKFDLENLLLPLKNIEEIRSLNLSLKDFGGNKLIEPGYPSLSLIYHMLASPRSKPLVVKHYPSIRELDILENFIFELKNVDLISLLNDENYGLAVLSYEYRPAYKTPTLDPINPFKKCAQLVYSRSGVSRIGNRPLNFDRNNRCFTNEPKDENDSKNIAVTPARYGLFLVKLVSVEQDSTDSIKLMNYQDVEKTNLGDRYFINPIMKLYNTSNINVEFSEFHINEKLYKLSQFEYDNEKIKLNGNFKLNQSPFTRISCTNDNNDKLDLHNDTDEIVKLKRFSSSVLLIPTPKELVTLAKQDNQNIAFYVTKTWKKNNQSNRRYKAFKVTDSKTKEIYDAVFTDFIFRRKRRTSRFRAPKNAPLFVNIKHETNENSTIPLDNIFPNFEKKIKNGGYYAQLFEDNISDGCVSAKLKLNNENFISDDIMSAFSLVTAPDFFPNLDSNDIRNYYMSKKIKMDEHFLEGGSINLSGIRQRGNPRLINPYTRKKAFEDDSRNNKSFDTVTAVVSHNLNLGKSKDFNQSYLRDFKSSSYLPDTGTGIFYPGWDVTYSSEKNNEANPFFATFGLGSPFPEDMKLCAAANGMWPVLSPDAGRTFQGSLESFPILGKPNTAIPLMDIEIGLNINSPQVLENKCSESFGWDGEQGPYLFKKEKKSNTLFVNHTDIGRADYISNILNQNVGFDMSYLRELDSKELILRLDSIRAAIRSIDNDEVQKTKYWLVSAEKVENWSIGAEAKGLSEDVVLRGGNSAVFKCSFDNGSGYFFLFAKTKEKELSKEIAGLNSKRRNQLVKEIVLCCVRNSDISGNTDVVHFKSKKSFPILSKEILWKMDTY